MPPDYPFKPPAFMLLTPNGRFETGTKICLSISSHHPEHWQPSWSVRTALTALIAFFPSPGGGALGSLVRKSHQGSEKIPLRVLEQPSMTLLHELALCMQFLWRMSKWSFFFRAHMNGSAQNLCHNLFRDSAAGEKLNYDFGYLKQEFPKEERVRLAALSRQEPPLFGSSDRQAVTHSVHQRMLDAELLACQVCNPSQGNFFQQYTIFNQSSKTLSPIRSPSRVSHHVAASIFRAC